MHRKARYQVVPYEGPVELAAGEKGFLATATCDCGWQIGAHLFTEAEALERVRQQFEAHVENEIILERERGAPAPTPEAVH